MGFQHARVISLLASSAYLSSTSFTVVPLEQTNIYKISRKGVTAVGNRIYSSRPLRQSSIHERRRRPSQHRKSDWTFNMDSPGFQSPSGPQALKVPTSPCRSSSFNDKLRSKLSLLKQQKPSTLIPHAAPDVGTVIHKVPSPTSPSPLSYIHNVMENTPPEPQYQPRRPQRYSVATSQLLVEQKPHSSMLKPRTHSFRHPSREKEVETMEIH